MSDPHSELPTGHGAGDATSASSDEDHAAQAAEADEHGHGDSLGPIDWVAWGAGLAGLLIGLGTAFAFAVATNRIG